MRDLQRENESLRNMLTLLLPMARATEEGITTSAYVRRMIIDEQRYLGDKDAS
jgi:hypothetical protein